MSDCVVNSNPQLKVHLARYQGMGWYELLVENVTLQSDKKYLVIMFGGSNGYVYEDNLNRFNKLNEQSEYYTLDELYCKYKDTDWAEVVKSTDYDNVTVQTVETTNI